MNARILLLSVLLLFISDLPTFAQDDTNHSIEYERITVENTVDIEQVATLGRGWIHKLLWTPDDKQLLVLSSNGLSIYEVGNWDAQQFIAARNTPMSNAAISTDGQRVAVAELDGLYVYDLITLEQVFQFDVTPVAYGATPMLIFTDEFLMANIWQDGLHIWDAATGDEVATDSRYPLWEAQNYDIADDILYSTNFQLDLSEILNGAGPQLLPLDFPVPYHEFSISLDGQTAASAGYIGSDAAGQGFAVWNTSDRYLISSKNTQMDFHEIATIDLNHNGSQLAVSGCTRFERSEDEPGYCNLWKTYLYDSHIAENPSILPDGFINKVEDVEYSWNGHLLAVADSNLVRVYDDATGLEAALLDGYHGPVWDLEFSPDGTILASSHYDGHYFSGSGTIFWDVTTLSDIPISSMPCGGRIDFHPDGSPLACSNNTYYFQAGHSTLQMWDVNTIITPQLRSQPEAIGKVEEVDFSPDGSILLASANYGHDPILFDWAQNQIVSTFEVGILGTRVYFSPDSTRIYPERYGVRYWNVQDILESSDQSFIEPTPLRDANADVITYSPSGDEIAVGDGDGTLYLLNAASGEIIHSVEVFENVRNAFTSLAYSPDGELLAAAGCIQVDRFCSLYDVRLINASTGDILVTLDQPTDPILALAFSPDGTLLATGSGMPFIWDGYGHNFVDMTSDFRIRVWAVPPVG